MGNGFEIGMKDASLCVNGLAMSVMVGGRIEALGELILSFGG